MNIVSIQINPNKRTRHLERKNYNLDQTPFRMYNSDEKQHL